jgi:hypothetical protein
VSLSVRIDRIVLDGIALTPAERHALGPALEAELTDRLARVALAPELRGGGAVPRLSGGTIYLPAPAGLAGGISTAVARGLSCH